ncbi:tetratricopeptide repeat protein [Kibdelosporangium philippinense]|uniref:Tetratricopeptide repeat protein n=1 Tax=Kibdelosporangium philippinense TaxID=211113 RepID=A0ABS8Z332_9PSEU|nr:tetratricopeptide repeat protein [Kibdelosporangium philippinense]MCE7001747.1 tetratricopeptide repeat protein [Kibdelosporangium philippinense]
MGERRALVIASQCEGLNLLSFLPNAARDVAEVLLDPSIGGCVPALPDTPLLVDPTAAELDSAVTSAFERASEDEATLFIALVGHGEYTFDDFYFLVKDTPLPPNSRTAFLLAQRIRELLGQHSLLDGLVLLLDTCHAGIAAQQAGDRWIQIVGQAGRRFEVLTASDDRAAANGCFSKQLVNIMRSGHAELGARLRCPDMKVALSGLCPSQTAVHLAFDGRREITAGDEGLWLARNTSDAWRSSQAADNPAADLIDTLTRDYVPPQQLQTLVGHLLMGTRTITVAGSDKSSLIAALARPSVARAVIPPQLMDAVVFVSATDTVERIATELARQLSKNVPGFADAARTFESSADEASWNLADAFERAVAGPLRDSQLKARIAVDGVDDLPTVSRDRLVHALLALENAQIVLAVGSPITAEAQIWVGAPIKPDVRPTGDPGGTKSWIPPNEEPDEVEAPPTDIGPISPPELMDLVRACGKAPVPTSVLIEASGLPVSAVRDFVLQQNNMRRLDAGTSRETVAITGSLPPGSTQAHSAIADTLIRLAPPTNRASGSPEQVYADAMAAVHLWHANRVIEVLQCLEQRGSKVPAENHAMWELWSSRIATAIGTHAKVAIIAQARYLTSKVKIGDAVTALSSFETLLPTAEKSLSADDPEIFSIRNNIGYLLFELDRPTESEAHLRMVIDQATRLLGPHHPETLHARHLHAVATGKLGDGTESARLSLELIPVAEAALGPDNEVTINSRLNYDFYTSESAYPPPDVFRQPTPTHRVRGRAEG